MESEKSPRFGDKEVNIMKSRRIQDIKRMLLEKKQVSNAELCEAFSVSIETIRRDLNTLENEGFIRKVYGGARLTDAPTASVTIEKWDDRLHKNEIVKRNIAAKAASLIPDGSTVFLDTGTSVFETLPYFKEKKNLTILTNSLRVASELGMCDALTVYCIGGVIKPDMLVSTGFFATELLSYFCHIDYAIISCDGFNPSTGTAEYSIELSMLKKNILKKVDHIIATIDHDKFGVPGCCLCCPTSEINTLITDSFTSEDTVAMLQKQGLQVMVVDTQEEPSAAALPAI